MLCLENTVCCGNGMSRHNIIKIVSYFIFQYYIYNPHQYVYRTLRHKITLIFLLQTREAHTNLLQSARNFWALRENQVLNSANSNNVNSRLINLACNMLDYIYARIYGNKGNIGISNKYAAFSNPSIPRGEETRCFLSLNTTRINFLI